MEIIIRPERLEDYQAVFDLIKAAFKAQPESDQQESFLVERLRSSEAFVPALALVAEIKTLEASSPIIGYVLLTEITIEDILEDGLHEPLVSKHTALALAPIVVDPIYQLQGIGKKLMHAAHEQARGLNYKAIVVLGHADYYPKFGYKPAHQYQISFPFEAPAENCMILELFPNALKGIQGKVHYAPEFEM